MTQPRKKLTKSISESVLNEYSHLCSICGSPRPQIHHIDEDHSNNDPNNLLPLCPNHHLTDIHNPTKKMDPLKLRLFRKYKDPQILSSQFEPIFQRLRFLLLLVGDEDDRVLSGHGAELCKFIEGFAMGSYYEARVRELLEWPQPKAYSDVDKESTLAQHKVIYFEQVQRNKDRVLELVVEQLRYQLWPIYQAKPWALLRA